ncbi:hypothetical protein M758_7G166500 [Ceratodon purpureus]|nr:hypothetical protein M758_7G166500 [Ceratodon purpureus]
MVIMTSDRPKQHPSSGSITLRAGYLESPYVLFTRLHNGLTANTAKLLTTHPSRKLPTLLPLQHTSLSLLPSFCKTPLIHTKEATTLHGTSLRDEKARWGALEILGSNG